MNNNDIIKRLRYALNISNYGMAEIFMFAGYEIKESQILDFLKKEDDEGYVEISDRKLELFLDGLIICERGKKETPDAISPVKSETRLSNNIILKKLRIALDFKDTDMHEMFRLSGFEITKPELSALFRKKGHKNYKVCGDQILKNFLKGLTVKFRK
jgi:uncharacterized protein YehS (DUF1456 family)